MMESMKQIQGLAERLAEAAGIVEAGQIEPMEDLIGAWYCTSPTAHYVVMPDGRCNCPDYEYHQDLHGGWCKHRIAAHLVGSAPGLTLRVSVDPALVVGQDSELIPIPTPCWR